MKPLRRRHPHPEIPLVSTADVGFLLLIFFLSTAIFRADRALLLRLPPPGESGFVVPAERVVRIEVLPDRGVLLDGRRPPGGRLREALAERLLRKPDLLVALAVHPAVPYAALVETLDDVKLSGARRISLRTEGGS
ncbi:MAG TPA: biopolymer transporter ExbD [Planctomycetota bacterium]|nr:biopolymer transporter ExbD [Planctomycetota bacterium]